MMKFDLTQPHASSRLGTTALLSLLLSIGLAGCAQTTSSRPQESVQSVLAIQPDVPLEGTWEYEESGQTILITLDKHGNGTYRWKDGKFMTTSCSNGVWKGWWSQRENDRAGQFEVKLSPDGSEGEGRWWYTHIGPNVSPNHRGGLFHIARQNGDNHVIQSGADEYDPFAISDRVRVRDPQ